MCELLNSTCALVNSTSKEGSGIYFSNFQSEMLAQYLWDYGIYTDMINGTSSIDGSHHIWLSTTYGKVIDVTANQFEGRRGMSENIELLWSIFESHY